MPKLSKEKERIRHKYVTNIKVYETNVTVLFHLFFVPLQQYETTSICYYAGTCWNDSTSKW